ncbi:MAG: aminotransferase class IV, partial [Calditrichota bacterium]
VKDGTLFTPPLSLGILSGTMRDAVMELSEEESISCRERLISLKEVDSMDEAFLTSTSIKILPVQWDGWQSDFSLTHHLKVQLNKYLTH